jgi:hypothetical protein
MFSVAASKARNGTTSDHTAPAGETTTPGGLARRVPGAQRPDAAFGTRAAAPDAVAEPVRTSPEDVYSFLSSFQSGVARGRADANDDTDTDHERMEDGR